MKKSTLLFLSLIFTIALSAQININISNQKTIGGSKFDRLNDVIRTSDGGYLLAIESNSGISYDKTEDVFDFYDWWIIKLDSSLNIEWQNDIGSSGFNGPEAIEEVNDGYLICGMADSLADGDKTVENYGDRDVWLVKLDFSGNIYWQNVYGGNKSDQGRDMMVYENTIYITATSDSDSSGTKSESNRGWIDIWLIAIDMAGNQVWDKTFGGDQTETFPSIDIKDGKIFVAIESLSDQSYEKTEDSYGSTDTWVVCLDTTGNILWDKSLGGSWEEDYPLVKIINDTVVVASSSYSDNTGNKQSANIGTPFSSSDIWIKYLDTSGQILGLDTVYGGSYGELKGGLNITDDGTILLSTTSSSLVSGNKTEGTMGAHDYWVLELNKSGEILWQKDIGADKLDIINNAFKISSNKYILFGRSTSGANGHKSGYNRGEDDIWIVELTVDGVGVKEQQAFRGSVYPVPAQNYIHVDSPFSGTCLLYDACGSMLRKINLEAGSNITNVENLPEGIFLFRFYDSKGNYKGSRKWLKM